MLLLAIDVTAGSLQVQPERPRPPQLTRRAQIAGLASLAALVPRAAEASFGSARGAVTSPPVLTLDFGVEAFLDNPRYSTMDLRLSIRFMHACLCCALLHGPPFRVLVWTAD